MEMCPHLPDGVIDGCGLNKLLVCVGGDDLLIAKKSKLPVREIMFKERKGGWGRSIRGAESAVERLLKEGFPKQSVQLDAHVKLCVHARKLQPANLKAATKLDQLDEIMEAVRKLKKHQATFHGETMLLLLKQRMKREVEKLKIAGLDRSQVVDGVNTMMSVSSPWCIADAEQAFDVLNPTLSMLPIDTAARLEIFTEVVVEDMLVLMIKGAEQQSAAVLVVAECIRYTFGQIDMIRLDTQEAKMVSHMMDIAKALSGILGGFYHCLQFKEEIQHLRDAADGSVQKSLCALVGHAIMQTPFYHEQISLFFDNEEALKVVLPLMARHEEEFKTPELSSALKSAAKFVVTHEKTVPADVFVDFNRLVEATSHSHWKDLKETFARVEEEAVAFQIAAAHCSAKLFSEAVQELQIAYPLAPWTHDMNAQVGEVLRSVGDKQFAGQFCGGLVSLNVALKESRPASEEEAFTVAQSLLNAIAGHHFKDDYAQAAIVETIGLFENLYPVLPDPIWSGQAKQCCEISRFLSSEKHKHMKARLALLQQAMLLDSAVDSALNMANEMSLRDKVATVITKKLQADKLLVPESLGPAPAAGAEPLQAQECVEAVAKRAMTAATRYIKDAKAMTIQATKDSIKDVEKEVAPYALGSNTNDGASWCGQKELAEWTCFEDLTTQFGSSLGLLKPSQLKIGMKKLEAILDDAKKTNDVFEEDCVDVTSVCELYRKVVRTKLAGVLVRTMSKKGKDPEALRSMVRTEILKTKDDFKSVCPFACARLGGRSAQVLVRRSRCIYFAQAHEGQ